MMSQRNLNGKAACWAVASLKGGVGKTTTATTLAHGLALSGRRVLLVDCDSQNQVRVVFGLDNQPGLDALLQREVTFDEAIISCSENLDVIPAGDRLSKAAREVNLLEMAQERELAKALKPALAQYDYIIFDTSPGWDIILINALIASDFIISPITMQVLAVESQGKFMKRLAIFQEEREDFGVNIVLPTIYDRRLKDARSILSQLHEILPGKVMPPIRKTVNVERASSIGMTIMDSLTSGVPPEGAAADYAELVKRVIEVSENGRK
ncbi:ParA family protein [Desulfovibrio sp. OttesenSCG-928-C14]|nr:ParA family protein [Desulfovibrio sp. OttesenSCG-928-C14]